MLRQSLTANLKKVSVSSASSVSNLLSSKASIMSGAIETRAFSTSAQQQRLTWSKYPFLKELGLTENMKGVWTGKEWRANGSAVLQSVNPATGELIADIRAASKEDYEACVQEMNNAKSVWQHLPMPQRGEVVRAIGQELRQQKDALGALISLEMGKIRSEGLGEVQEAIDICDHASGLSRTLGGQVLPSERADHVLLERWNPYNGHVGIISAFNFPCAVYFWNLAISMVCGNTHMWKGSHTTSLTSIALTNVVNNVLTQMKIPGGVATLAQGDADIGKLMTADPRFDLISFTGSTAVGKDVAVATSSRFARNILELGGNNALIVLPDANLDMALRSVVFGAVGTAGQRCTSLRRLLLHQDIYDDFVSKVVKAYKTVPIGDPLKAETLCGPLHSQSSVDRYKKGIEEAVRQGGRILYGGKVIPGPGYFVEPTIIEISHDAPCVKEELFAPVMYVIRIRDFEEGVRLNNSVPQGLSSCLFSNDLSNVWKWLGPDGSDCGLVNVNVGTSGAEIGGAFGGEKATGGGRESGSDAWKQYMRRSTIALNYGKNLPLAQGVRFDVGS